MSANTDAILVGAAAAAVSKYYLKQSWLNSLIMGVAVIAANVIVSDVDNVI